MEPAAARVCAALAAGPRRIEALGGNDGPCLDRTLDVMRSRALIAEAEGGRLKLHQSLSFDGSGLQRIVPTRYLVTYTPVTDSTNRLAQSRSVPEPPLRRLVVAREQTGGRGRFDRSWESPAGGIWATVVDGRSRSPTAAWTDQLAMSLAVTDVAADIGVDALVKWPNDVVDPDGGKLAGVLAEATLAGGSVEHLCCGVGLNADIDPTSLPSGATSLRAHTGSIAPVALVARLLERYEAWQADPSATRDAWMDRSATLGRPVVVLQDEGRLTGTATDLGPDGELVVETDTGTTTVSPSAVRRLRHR